MSVARFIADQRTKYRVPHAVCCRFLGVSPAWFYKWVVRGRRDADPTGTPAPGAVAAAGQEPEPAQDPLVGSGRAGGGACAWAAAGRSLAGCGLGGSAAAAVAGYAGAGRVRGQRRHVRVAAGARGPVRGGVAGVGEHGRGLDASSAVAWPGPKRRRRGLTRPDMAAKPFPDLLGRDFTAPAPNVQVGR